MPYIGSYPPPSPPHPPRGMDTISGKATLSKLFCLSSEKGSTLKNKTKKKKKKHTKKNKQTNKQKKKKKKTTEKKKQQKTTNKQIKNKQTKQTNKQKKNKKKKQNTNYKYLPTLSQGATDYRNRILQYFPYLTLVVLGKIFSTRYIEIYTFYSKKTGFDISGKLSPTETICLKCQILFSGGKKRKYNQFDVC